MLHSKHFVFLHAPKTGGTFIRSCLSLAPPEWCVEDGNHHVLYKNLPARIADMPKFGFVRNPWDWYVSWYSYFKTTHDQEFQELSCNRTLDFTGTMRNWIEKHGSCSSFLQTWLGDGFNQCRIGKMENLRKDLLTLLSTYVTIPRSMAHAIENRGRQRVSERGEYQKYYSVDFRDQIATIDTLLIDKFNYHF
jgi:hypothetical protein